MNLRDIGSNVSSMSRIQEYIKGLKFPVNKQEIINSARSNNAESNVISMLQKLPDKVFQSQSDLMNELGKIS